MALIKCKECGKEISSSSSVCPNCGIELKSFNKSKVIGISFIVVGVVSIIWGLGLNYSGISSSDKSYGGDAYTGIQNASSTTANNVRELGETVCSGLKGILVVMGGAIIICGASIVIKDVE